MRSSTEHLKGAVVEMVVKVNGHTLYASYEMDAGEADDIRARYGGTTKDVEDYISFSLWEMIKEDLYDRKRAGDWQFHE